MRVYVDDDVFESGLDPESTVGELVAEVRASLCGTDRIVMEIRADGLDITGVNFAKTLEDSVASFERYDFVSSDPRKVVGDALADCGDILDAAEVKRRETIDLLTRGESAVGAAALGECCRAWQQVHEAICSSIGLLGLDPSTLLIEEGALAAALTGARDQLAQVREALQARDFVLVSDILQYEFELIINGWRAAVGAIADDAGA